MNSVILIGRLVRDPELRYVSGNTNSVCRFTLAVDRGMSKDKRQEAESRGLPTADFINVVVWGKQAENCQKYLQKGRNVAISGKIQSSSYVASDGTKRYSTDVNADRVQFIDWGDATRAPRTSGGMDQDFSGFTDSEEGYDLPFQDASDEELPF